MTDRESDFLGVIAIIVFMLYLLFVIVPDMIEQEKAHETELEADRAFYCEMVDIRRNSGDPNLGWPDYKEVYDEECAEL